MPDVCKDSVHQLINIIGSGFIKKTGLSIDQVGKVKEAAKMLQIDLTELSTVSVVDPVIMAERQEYFETGDANISAIIKEEVIDMDIKPLISDIKEEVKNEYNNCNDNEKVMEFDFEQKCSTLKVENSVIPKAELVDKLRERTFKSKPEKRSRFCKFESKGRCNRGKQCLFRHQHQHENTTASETHEDYSSF